ncbi:unnamed protein product, partial [Porites lobata]
ITYERSARKSREKKWVKAEIKAAIFTYWRSIRDDAIRRKNGKLQEHRIMTRRLLRVRWTLAYRQEMVEKSTLSPQDKVKNKCTLTVVKMPEAEETLSGPPGRHIKPLLWERTGLRNIKVVLDATYQARMRKREKRTAAKLSRIADQNMSDRPLPKNCPSWAGRVANGII